MLSACTPEPPEPSPAPDVDLSVSLGFDDVTAGPARHRALAEKLGSVKATGVSLAVGRPDWTAFDWPAHPDTRAAGTTDHVRDAIATLAPDGRGGRREITLVIDVFAPRLLAQFPAEAGVDAHGAASELRPGAAAYYSGTVGRRVVELCGASAERYRPTRVALTELFLEDTYSDADLALYRSLTGRDDWPRTPDGTIDETHESLDEFRVAVVNNLVGRCAEAAGRHGVGLEADVRAPWDAPAGSRRDSGHDYPALMMIADRLTIWNYFAINDRDPQYSSTITAGLRDSLGADALDRVTMSVGLWASGDGEAGGSGAITPDALAAGLAASATNGVTSVAVTPASLMTDAHWAALADLRNR